MLKMLSTRIAVIVFSLATLQSNAQVESRPVNKFLYNYEFELLDSSFSDYILTSPFVFRQLSHNTLPTGSPSVILDNKGFVAMYFRTSVISNPMFKYNETLNQFTLVFIDGGPIYTILDDKFDIIDTVVNAPGTDTEGHEFVLLDNGNRILAGQKMDTVDLSHLIIGGQPGYDTTVLRGFLIEEFDQNNNLLFQWNSNDDADPTESNLLNRYRQFDFDYCHGNAIEKDKNGDYYVSLRNFDSVYKIDGKTGKTIWKLGGKNSSFVFENDSGFSGQHDIRIMNNGNLTVFDNGNTRSPIQYSRAIELELDTIKMIAKIVWEYVEQDSTYSRAMGSHQTTAQRNHLINYGVTLRPLPSITVCDDQKNDLCRVFLQDTAVSYRSQLMPGTFDLKRPTLDCKWESSKLYLTIENNSGEVIWSNDETTPTIEISTPGIYQAWIQRGNAMIGSYPVNVETVSDHCKNVSVNELLNVEDEDFDKYINILGQPINLTNHHGLYFELGTKGTLTKRFKP